MATRKNAQSTARLPRLLMWAALVGFAVLLLASFFGAQLLHRVSQRVEDLTNRQDAQFVLAVQDLQLLFKEQQQFLAFIGRRGYQTRDTQIFIERCRRELTDYAQDDRLSDFSPHLVAQAFHRLAQMEMVSGNYYLANGYLQNALQHLESSDEMHLLGLVHNTRGVTLCRLGQYPAAAESFSASANCLAFIPAEREVLALALRNLHHVRQSLGSQQFEALERAVQLLQPHNTRYELSPGSEMLIDALAELAEGHMYAGNREAALSTLRRMQPMLESLCTQARNTWWESEIVSHRRYVHAQRLLEQNLQRIQRQQSPTTEQTEIALLPWPRLFDSPTELLEATLRLEGYAMAEFEPQTAIALPWSDYQSVKRTSEQIVRQIHDHVPVLLIVASEAEYYEALQFLNRAQIAPHKVKFCFADLESPWLRDMGPLVGRTSDGQPVWIDSQVVHQGMKMRVTTDALPNMLSSNWQSEPMYTALGIEGGAILSNGQGLVVCSTSILEKNSEAGFDRSAAERELTRVMGAEQVVFVDPLPGESTGHIDMFMTFTDPETLVLGSYRNEQHAAARLLDQHARRLSKISLSNDAPLRVVRIPMPPDPKRQFTNYTNVIFANGKLLVPSWSSSPPELEEEVRVLYQSLLPKWELEFIDCTALANGGGALHCLSSNLGAAVWSQPMD